MKVLYAIQGTGNGHLSRAGEIVPMLNEYAQVDILISGSQADIKPNFPVKYKLSGLSFYFGKKGGIDVWDTISKASLIRLKKEFGQLPVENYDLVINDFEPISAWACQIKEVPCMALSHQSALLQPNVPMPAETDFLGSFILRNYAPSHDAIGFHFDRYSEKIYTPVIRNDISFSKPTNKGYYCVYLPAYDDYLLATMFSKIKHTRWEIFSKSGKSAQFNSNIRIHPVNSIDFVQSMVHANGVLCGAGFETPAEALYLGKKLLVVPMKGQFEQHCNAAALATHGVAVINSLNDGVETLAKLNEWVESDLRVQIHYQDHRREIIETLFERAVNLQPTASHPAAKGMGLRQQMKLIF